MKIVKIKWEDASFDGRQFSLDNVSDRKGVYDLESVGFLVHEDDRRIAITMERSTDTRTNVRHVSWIPKSAVLEIVGLESEGCCSVL
jgi:hypothetical protein